MKYTILAIDDSRKHYTDAIRRELADWTEVPTRCVNGNDSAALRTSLLNWNLKPSFKMKTGQIGCTLSTLNALAGATEPLLILNDDALLMPGFAAEFERRIATLPDDADVFTCFIPRDHDNAFYTGVYLHGRLETMSDYYREGHPMFESNGTTCRAYMRYGGVALYFTERGRQKYLNLPHLTEQMDDLLYLANHFGYINVYASVPSLPDLAYITGTEESICQETDYYHAVHGPR